jgi:hypothetical protein
MERVRSSVQDGALLPDTTPADLWWMHLVVDTADGCVVELGALQSWQDVMAHVCGAPGQATDFLGPWSNIAAKARAWLGEDSADLSRIPRAIDRLRATATTNATTTEE